MPILHTEASHRTITPARHSRLTPFPFARASRTRHIAWHQTGGLAHMPQTREQRSLTRESPRRAVPRSVSSTGRPRVSAQRLEVSSSSRGGGTYDLGIIHAALVLSQSLHHFQPTDRENQSWRSRTNSSLCSRSSK